MDFFDIYEKEVRQQYEPTPEPETGMFEVEETKEQPENVFDYDKLANIIFEKIKEERKEQKTETTNKPEFTSTTTSETKSTNTQTEEIEITHG